MQELLRSVIYKYTNINIDDDNQNLLDLPVVSEYWLYVLLELEDKYNLPIIRVIEKIYYNEFTLKEISEKLALMSEQS